MRTRDHAVGAVAGVGDTLHERVVQIADAETEHGERDAGSSLLHDEVHELLGRAWAHVEITVGAEQNVIGAALDERRLRLSVREVDARGTGGAPARLEARDDTLDCRSVRHRRRRQTDRRIAGVGDDRDRIGRLEHVERFREHDFHEGKLVGARHAARDIHEKHEVRGLLLFARQAPLDPDAKERGADSEEAARRGEVNGERFLRVGRRRLVAVAEAIDVLFEPDAVRLRQIAALHVAAKDVVARGVGVGGEGR
jgi:hypothetical protein